MSTTGGTIVTRFIDRWVPDEFQRYPKQRTQASICLAFLILNNLYCLLSLLFLEYALPNLGAQALQVGRNLVFMSLGIYTLAAIFYFVWRRLQVAGHLLVTGLFVSSVSSLFVTGGYMQSPLPVMTLLVPTFAFLLLGLFQGIIWSVFTMGTLLLMWLLEQNHVLEPMQLLVHPDVKKNLTLWVPMTLGSMLVVVMIFYETITNRLREELQTEKNKFQWDASHDSLTGLPNRVEFFHRLRLGIRNAEVNEQALALVYVDLDGFKPINDQFGHHIGDEVLKTVSKRIQSILRGSDSVARLGGDEFAIILQGASTNQDIMDGILAKALQAISEKMLIEGKEVSVGASMGVVYFDKQDSDINILCRKADLAMYEAKEKKNTWRYYDTPAAP